MLTLTVFSLLTAYYLLKTAREPLILLEGGAEVKSYAAVGQSFLLIGIVRAYSAIARRVGRLKLLAIIYFFFVSNLVLFAILARAKVHIGVIFFLWVGIFNVTAIAQFWSFANDVYTEEQGKRLFAIIGIGSSVGAVAGAKFAQLLVPLGTSFLMIAAAVILAACVGLIAIVDKREGSPGKKKNDPHHDEPLVDARTFRMLLHDKYLILIAGLTLVLNCVNKTGEYMLDRALLAGSPAAHGPGAEAFIGAFKADYFSWINLVGVLMQLFAVSRIIKYLGVRGALFCLPAIAFAGYTASFIAPVIAIVRLTKIAENSFDYSIQSTTNQTLYLVTSRAEKYVGKTIIDTFIVRFGDVISAGFVGLGAKLALSTRQFAGINLVLIGLWVLMIFVIGKENKKRSDEGEGEKKDQDRDHDRGEKKGRASRGSTEKLAT